MDVNDYQIGGNHYRSDGIQHWDFVIKTNLHYILANATKYLSRWRHKNGIQDLRKCVHYLSKAMDEGLLPVADSRGFLGQIFLPVPMIDMDTVFEFTKTLHPFDARIVELICLNEYPMASARIDSLITKLVVEDAEEAGASYVNQG